MAKYLIDSTDIEIEEVSGTQNLKFNLASGNNLQTQIGDLSNLTTTDQTDLVSAINEVQQIATDKEYIMATISTGQSIASNTVVQLDSTVFLEGNFSLTNNKIVIGNNIHHVRISACFFVESWNSGSYFWGEIIKNNTQIAGNINSSSTSYVSATIPCFIVSVAENDEIQLIADAYGTTAYLRAGGNNNWILVEKID